MAKADTIVSVLLCGAPAVADYLDLDCGASVWRLMREDATFPRPIALSAQRRAWVKTEVDYWIASRPRVGGEE